MTPERTTAKLTDQGVSMIGKIATREKCPVCGSAFNETKKGFACKKCKTKPNTVYISLWWGGKSHDIRHNNRGERLDNYAKADQTLNCIRVEHQRGSSNPADYKLNSPKRFEVYFTAWLRRYEKQKSTHRKLKSLGKNYFLKAFGKLNMQDIKKFDLENFFVDLDGISDRYKLDLWTWLKAIFMAAHEDEFINQPPKMPKKPTFQKPPIKWLTQAEQLKVLNEISVQHRDVFRFLVDSGVRVSEACALMRDCIGTDYYIIKRTLSDRKLKETTKNKKPLTKYMPPSMAELIRRQPLNFAGFVFSNPDGKHTSRHYTEDFLNAMWKKASAQAGVEVMPLKNGSRHSWGTNRVVSGCSIEEVAHGLGHGDARMTKNYVAADLERQKAMYGD